MLPIPPFIGVIRLNLFSSCLIMASGRPTLEHSHNFSLDRSTIASANVDSLIFESVLRGDALLISLHAVGGGGGAVVGLDSGTGSMSPNVSVSQVYPFWINGTRYHNQSNRPNPLRPLPGVA
ncbi:hypothetical protein EVAR_54773_1 [Eumeta japonica]|uniref:Uncharacterized protein n=1 Tax=Eumeta variegata TaxID=151549 RepID=A0A4C1YF38_EUMVA|nr:hypothetical protein EVAR_54773_1 [Eumeta japonica]